MIPPIHSIHLSIRPTILPKEATSHVPSPVCMEYTSNIQVLPCRVPRKQAVVPRVYIGAKRKSGMIGYFRMRTIILGGKNGQWPSDHPLLPSFPGAWGWKWTCSWARRAWVWVQCVWVWVSSLFTYWMCDLRWVPFPLWVCFLICKLELTMCTSWQCQDFNPWGLGI